mmetsp:Transcript_10747/g.43320  ORF Transcript_10747/g.43320 Transcript_10747/m.43320 type:complete len:264 (+) Transcript_10747:557-1348(+)
MRTATSWRQSQRRLKSRRRRRWTSAKKSRGCSRAASSARTTRFSSGGRRTRASSRLESWEVCRWSSRPNNSLRRCSTCTAATTRSRHPPTSPSSPARRRFELTAVVHHRRARLLLLFIVSHVLLCTYHSSISSRVGCITNIFFPFALGSHALYPGDPGGEPVTSAASPPVSTTGSSRPPVPNSSGPSREYRDSSTLAHSSAHAASQSALTALAPVLAAHFTLSVLRPSPSPPPACATTCVAPFPSSTELRTSAPSAVASNHRG